MRRRVNRDPPKEHNISFDAPAYETNIIHKIVERAYSDISGDALPKDRLSLTMDITACHCNGTPLRLEGLLGADSFNFLHDVLGITKHMDRETGQLDGRFLPRYSKRE